MKHLSWIGSSKDDLILFPVSVRREAGFQLDLVQRGQNPTDWKPMASIGVGVREIRIRDDSGAFRVIYVAQIADAVHVLHCFQKKTPKTSPRDLQMAKERFKALTK